MRLSIRLGAVCLLASIRLAITIETADRDDSSESTDTTQLIG